MKEGLLTVELEGPLKGYSLDLDMDKITLGFFEDLESPYTRDNLNALQQIIVGGKLPKMPDGVVDRQSLRSLNPDEFNSLATSIARAMRTPKNA